MPSLEEVPDELLIYILLYACEHPADLIKVSHISPKFSEVVNSPVIWNLIPLTRSSKSDFTKPNKLPNSLGPSILLFKYFDRKSPIHYKQTKHKHIDKLSLSEELTLKRIDLVEDIVFHNKQQYIETRKYLYEKHSQMLETKKRRQIMRNLGQKLGNIFPILCFCILQFLILVLFLALMQTNLYFGLPEWVLLLEQASTAVATVFLPIYCFLILMMCTLIFVTFQSRYVKVTQQYNLWVIVGWLALFLVYNYLNVFKQHLINYFTNSKLYEPFTWFFVLVPLLGGNLMAFVLLLLDETRQKRIIWMPLSFHFPNYQEAIPILFNLFSIPFFIALILYLCLYPMFSKLYCIIPLFGMELIILQVIIHNMRRYYSYGKDRQIEALLLCLLVSLMWTQMRIYYENFHSFTYVPTFLLAQVLLLRAVID